MNNWMSRLPNELKQQSILTLCIPGSHDSGAYNLSTSQPTGHDQPMWKMLRRLSKLHGSRTIIKRWSETQTLSITDQLNIGIRYLDVRFELIRKHVEEGDFNNVKIVHALYGVSAPQFLVEITDFLNKNPEEIVILDINHVYRMNAPEFASYFAHPMLKLIDKDLIWPIESDYTYVTLSKMVSANRRLIIFGPFKACFFNAINPNTYIISRWPQTNKLSRLLQFMESEIEKTKEKPRLYVLQGVLTASTGDVIRNFSTSLLRKFGRPSREATIRFLNSLSNENKQKLNIVITDDVNEDFTTTVININFCELTRL
ncbi:unnamed protein product [Caenorhabditis bovis]|uniref:Phosphatidylinositol-specific phospholipase C X domain-containing protein n=1 Tax=Caenorhabditis bovis TaxID=2654633 RepID=A0A8S1EBX9_9PELO|nr:unnamed protein product [Caenorhabditis bovis]